MTMNPPGDDQRLFPNLTVRDSEDEIDRQYFGGPGTFYLIGWPSRRPIRGRSEFVGEKEMEAALMPAGNIFLASIILLYRLRVSGVTFPGRRRRRAPSLRSG
jgi:hypothetical protein